MNDKVRIKFLLNIKREDTKPFCEFYSKTVGLRIGGNIASRITNKMYPFVNFIHGYLNREEKRLFSKIVKDISENE